ncbi:hypothetical protein H6F43_17025 [Leptolyngbya sp. FACHB-36]|uniref:hypothetical protein n=1 Tax=Leptolyngbya sp. FACHB-36 TaxID=2692808 RepID=UPI00167FFEC3|nr:hypothetical protein [Leptolyngbya sp. FACHB-36]MBD2021886.1 hypothetical protein [Leptolyngbya sp. FACHB-36]
MNHLNPNAAAVQRLTNAAKAPKLPDPTRIYKAGEESRMVHRVDLAAWLRHGWSEDPAAEIVTAAEPIPPANPPAPPTPSPYQTRKAELEAMLKQPNGWRKLEAIGKPLGIVKPEGGWDESINLILAAEGLENA